jgi:hypothetical protein
MFVFEFRFWGFKSIKGKQQIVVKHKYAAEAPLAFFFG